MAAARRSAAMLERLGIKSEFWTACASPTSRPSRWSRWCWPGSINKEIVTAINSQGGKAVGISGKDANLMIARSRSTRRMRDPESNIEQVVDLGFVGDPPGSIRTSSR